MTDLLQKLADYGGYVEPPVEPAITTGKSGAYLIRMTTDCGESYSWTSTPMVTTHGLWFPEHSLPDMTTKRLAGQHAVSLTTEVMGQTVKFVMDPFLIEAGQNYRFLGLRIDIT